MYPLINSVTEKKLRTRFAFFLNTKGFPNWLRLNDLQLLVASVALFTLVVIRVENPENAVFQAATHQST